MINQGKILAKEIINNYCYNSFEEFNLLDIVHGEGLVIKEFSNKNFLGKLVSDGNVGIIYVNSNIREQGMKRFTIAHELGHYLLFKKLGSYVHIFRSQQYDIKSMEEKEANEFAAELLMHKPWFGKFIRDKKINLELLKEIAKYFDVTLTAAAFRYANIGQYPITVILSENGVIKSYFINEYFPYKTLKDSKKISKVSGAYKILNGDENFNEPILIEPYHWFDENILSNNKKIISLWEQNIFLKYYNVIMTILWEYNPYD